jgi:hypothetical protein
VACSRATFTFTFYVLWSEQLNPGERDGFIVWLGRGAKKYIDNRILEAVHLDYRRGRGGDIAFWWLLNDSTVMSEGAWNWLCSVTDYDGSGVEPVGLCWRKSSLRGAKFIYERYQPVSRCSVCLPLQVFVPVRYFVSSADGSHLVCLTTWYFDCKYLSLRKKLVKCYIWSTIVYGAETWALGEVDQKYLESFWRGCGDGWWRWVEPTVWEMRKYYVKEERNIVHTIKRRRKANWIGDILHRNCLLKHYWVNNRRRSRRDRKTRKKT